MMMIRLDHCYFFVISAPLFLHRRLDTVPVHRLVQPVAGRRVQFVLVQPAAGRRVQFVLVQPVARRRAQLVLALVHQLVHRLQLESLALLVRRRQLASETVERLSQGKDNNWHHFQVVHGFQRGLDRLAFRRFL